MPVFWPTPKRRSYSIHLAGPSRLAILRVPTLDDWARMPVAVYRCVGCDHASPPVTPPMKILSGTFIVVLGVMTPSCRAAAKVIDFCTDPGSKVDITGGFIGGFGAGVWG